MAARVAPGDLLGGKYRIKRVLGEGGVGLVVRATHVKLSQDVAIKMLRDPHAPERVVTRFAREARAAAQLRGEHAVRILDVDEEAGSPFIVMELLDGEDLDRVVRTGGPLPVERAAALLLQACEGLAEAHSLGIVHRDIKPANLMLARTRRGDELVKILDFGISKAAEEGGAMLTEPERPLGSPAFMSPEQLREAHDVDARSDVWSLGVTGYFLVAGKLPFDGATATRVATQIAADEPPQLPGEYGAAIARCLAKSRDQRFASVVELAQALAPCTPNGDAAARRVLAASQLGTARRSSGVIEDLPFRAAPQATQSLAEGTNAFRKPLGEAAAPSPRPQPKRRSWSLALAVALAGALAVAGVVYVVARGAPGPGGHCEGTVRVRLLFDLTGPTRDVNVDSARAIGDYLDDLRAHGGLRGCAIEVESADTKYDVETALAAFRAWRARPDWASVSTVFAGGTSIVQAVGPLVAEDGKVLVSLAYGGALAAPVPVARSVGVPSLSPAFAEATLPVAKRSAGFPAVFMPGTDYTTSARVAMSFAWKRGAHRVGFFACTTTAYCTDPVDGAKTFLPTLGTKIGRDLAIEIDDDDATVERKVEAYFRAELDHAAQDKSYVPVDWIWFGNQRTGLARFGRALARVKQHLPIDVQVIANNWALDESIYAICGDACVGFFGVQPLPAFGDGSAVGMKRLLEVHRAARAAAHEPADAHATAAYVAGYVAADAWHAAAEAALDEGHQPTGVALRGAFEKFSQRSIDGFATLTYTATDHRPQASARVYVLAAGGKLDKVGQPLSIALDDAWLGW